MPEPLSSFNQKLVLIRCSAPAELTKGGRKIFRVERYLARQARHAHILGVPALEGFYNIGYFALRLWRMERFENSGPGGKRG